MTVVLLGDSGVLFKHRGFVLIITSDPAREYTSAVVIWDGGRGLILRNETNYNILERARIGLILFE